VPTSVTVGTTVTFTDQSTNTPTSWLWTLAPTTGFTYANSTTSASQNPQITFTTAGTYSVTLKATNSAGNNSITKTSYITVNAVSSAPTVAFTASATDIGAGTTVTFTDQSTNTPTSWLWTLAPTTGFAYANSTTSASQNPQITFNTVGTYSVTLKATNTIGNNSLTKTSYITVSNLVTTCDTLYPPTALLACGDTLIYYSLGTNGYFTGNDSYGDLENAQRFTNTSSGTISNVIVAEKAIKNAHSSATYVKIYSVNATTKAPSTLLGTSNAVAMSAISTSGAYVSYSFAAPVSVTGDFYASVVLPTTSGDTLVVYGTKTTCNSGDSLAWQKWSDGTWYSFINPSNWGDNMDLAVYPAVCTTVTGTQEIANSAAQFNMYPNPANDQFTVDFAGVERNNVQINVYNLVGELVKSINPSSSTDKVLVDMSELKAGVYLVRVKTPEINAIKKISLIK